MEPGRPEKFLDSGGRYIMVRLIHNLDCDHIPDHFSLHFMNISERARDEFSDEYTEYAEPVDSHICSGKRKTRG